jgi:hypothetical protein
MSAVKAIQNSSRVYVGKKAEAEELENQFGFTIFFAPLWAL